MQHSFSITTQAGTFNLYQWGEGPELWIGLHGFRQSGKAFAKMAADLPERITLIAPDLPFHGQTNWLLTLYLPEHLEELIKKILKVHQKESCHLIGFSLGGHLASGLVLRNHLPIDQLTLLAPDTPSTKWGWFTFRVPYFFRFQLERLLSRLNNYDLWLQRLHQWGIIDRFTLRFLQRTLHHDDQRRQLFGTWRSRYHFPFSFRIIRSLSIPVGVILGLDDPLIPANKLRQKFKGADIKVLKSGHEVLSYPGIANLLLKPNPYSGKD